MLLTRCPSCHTTFRITAEALSKAGGQVRCGRCAAVFNAHSELREQPPPAVAVSADASARAEAPAAAARTEAPIPAAGSDAITASAAELGPASRRESERGPALAAPPPEEAAERMADVPFGELSVAELVAQVERGGDSDVAVERDVGAPPLSPVEIDATLAHAQQPGFAPSAPEDWLSPPLRSSRRWRVGAIAAALALAVQIVHHFRNDLARHSSIGPLLAETYSALGAPLTPRWDIAQYQILDWVANAEPNANGQGSLRISARVHNRGPHAQPYPSIRLQLKDRWQASVGSRVFSPAEYLEVRPRRDALMTAGATARAELAVLDPGPDAYGFELDVCIEIDGILGCGADRVFK